MDGLTKNALLKEIENTNAAADFILGITPDARVVPGTWNAGGWTDDTGKVSITEGAMLPKANIAAHEGVHSRMRRSGSEVPGAVGNSLFWLLLENMSKLQSKDTPKDWGLNPGSSPEELIANLRGYEGSLPRGMPITQSPIAGQLFDRSSYPLMSENALKDFYYRNSSLPYQSIWEGQAPEAGLGIMDAIKRYALSLGLNTVNR